MKASPRAHPDVKEPPVFALAQSPFEVPMKFHRYFGCTFESIPLILLQSYRIIRFNHVKVVLDNRADSKKWPRFLLLIESVKKGFSYR